MKTYEKDIIDELLRINLEERKHLLRLRGFVFTDINDEISGMPPNNKIYYVDFDTGMYMYKDTAVKGGDIVPPRYSDGSFRLKNKNTGLLEYRFIHDGIQRPVTGYSQQECFNKRTDIIANNTAAKTKHTYTVGEYAEKYNGQKVRADGSIINPDNLRYLKQIQSHKIGHMPLNKATSFELKEFLFEYNDRPNTRNKVKIFLNELFSNAADNQTIKFNPMRAVKIDKHTPEGYNVIQPAEQNIILHALKDVPRYEAMFWYLCCTGMRLDTALQSISGIDIEKCIINVTKPDTSTKKHKAQIPFLPELFIGNRIGLLNDAGYSGTEQFFRELFRKLQLDLVVHSCRKTFASCAYHVGFSDKWIQSMLRHSSISMTMDTYVNLIKNEYSPIIDYFQRLKKALIA